MKVILVYDISIEEPRDQNRLNKVRQVVRKYINHIQKSVFEGELSPSKLERLKNEVLRVVDKKRDSVIIYILEDGAFYERQILTDTPDPTDNII
ncbi:MAG: CRISPR-associated endonuclease Cas2 [Hydrogenobacter sp.]